MTHATLPAEHRFVQVTVLVTEEQAEYLERKDVPLNVVVGRSLNLMRLLEDEVSHGAEVHVVRGGLGRRVELWWAQ
jgi:hypothetical protein